MTIEEKISRFVNTEISYADRDGSSKFSTCNHSNWDKDIWAHRQTIVDALQSKGYTVTSSVNWGVTDYIVTKKLELNI